MVFFMIGCSGPIICENHTQHPEAVR
jgi:hypothetical protein